MANDELPGQVSRPVDGERPAPDQELVPGGCVQLEDEFLPARKEWHDPC
jgi:hypothetical protein